MRIFDPLPPSAIQSSCVAVFLFDQLVRAQQDRCRHIEAKRLGGFHIEHVLVFRSNFARSSAAISLSQSLTSKGLCRRIHFRRMPSANDSPVGVAGLWFGGNLAFGWFTDLPDYCSAASRSARSAASRSASTFSAAWRFASAAASIFAILAASRFASLAASRSTLRAASRSAFS